MFRKFFQKISYELIIIFFIIISISLVILDFSEIINISAYPYNVIDYSLLFIFWIDYLYFFIKSDNKKKYFKSNLLNLIAILPLNEILSFLRVSRALRITKIARFSKFTKFAKFTRLIKLFSFILVLKNKIEKFLNTNGFIYMIYCSIAMIISSAVSLKLVENKYSLGNYIWWSIVTTTTVGYGDITPTTTFGRIIAVILMIFGIGFIGMLTATITTFFSKEIGEHKNKKENKNKEILNLINELDEKQKEDAISLLNLLKNNENIKINI